ncbi:hypothetical protein R6Q57_020604 [Mikania cordata]
MSHWTQCLKLSAISKEKRLPSLLREHPQKNNYKILYMEMYPPIPISATCMLTEDEREDGVLQKAPRFFLKSKFDIRSINNAMFFNPSKDTQADLFAKFIKDQSNRDFPTMKTAKGRRFVSTCILDLVKKELWICYKYPPPATKKVVPVSTKVPDNSLVNFTFWYIDEKTHATIILRTKGDINDTYMILDPMDLLKVVAFAMEMKLYAGTAPHSVTLPIG